MPVISGGGPSPLTQTKITLTDAQIVALGTTPVTVVAGVAGKIIVPVASVLVIHGGAYSGTSGAAAIEFFLSDTDFASAGWGGSPWLNNPLSFPDDAIVGDPTIFTSDPEPLTLLTGKPLRMDSNQAITNSGAPGSATVTVTYMLVTPS